MHPDQVQQRGFTSARRAHDRDKLAFLDIHLDTPQDVGAAVARFVEFVQIRGSDHVLLFYLTDEGRMSPGGVLQSGREDGRQVGHLRASRNFHGDRDGGGAGYVYRTRQHVQRGPIRGGLEQTRGHRLAAFGDHPHLVNLAGRRRG